MLAGPYRHIAAAPTRLQKGSCIAKYGAQEEIAYPEHQQKRLEKWHTFVGPSGAIPKFACCKSPQYFYKDFGCLLVILGAFEMLVVSCFLGAVAHDAIVPCCSCSATPYCSSVSAASARTKVTAFPSFFNLL